jgi:hypothetical protein
LVNRTTTPTAPGKIILSRDFVAHTHLSSIG